MTDLSEALFNAFTASLGQDAKKPEIEKLLRENMLARKKLMLLEAEYERLKMQASVQ